MFVMHKNMITQKVTRVETHELGLVLVTKEKMVTMLKVMKVNFVCVKETSNI